MALTIIQELEIIRGELTPTSTDLTSLVHQSAFGYAKTFYDNLKDTTDNDEATSYVNKVVAVSMSVLRNDREIIQVLKRMIISIIGDSTFTYAQVSGADDDGWGSFVESQIAQAFEYIGDVRSDEKTAYDLL